MNRPLLSVVVPTRNRYFYLKYLIRLVESFQSDEIELVIQDNSDSNHEILDYLNKGEYKFVKYDYIKEQLPMSDNSDRAILNSAGEYICFLGDDDGLTRYTLDVVKWMKLHDVEAVKPADLFYYWPDADQCRGVSQSAQINYEKFTGSIKFISGYDELIKVLKGGIANRGNMPLVYHAIVSRIALDRVFMKCGTYFPGNSPDIANAVALSLVINKFALIDLPLSFSGNCLHKGGGLGSPGKKYPLLISDMPWFRNNAEINWDYRIPRVAVGETIWPESALNALKEMGREDLIFSVDFYRMYANFTTKHPTLKNFLEPINFDRTLYKRAKFKFLIKKYYNGIIIRIQRIFGYNVVYKQHGINNINEAVKKLEELSCDLFDTIV